MADLTGDEWTLSTAQAVLEDRIGIPEAVRTLSSHYSSGSKLVSEDDYNLFRGIDSETDHVPLGAVRAHWHTDSLKEKDAEVTKYEELSRNLVRSACERILANSQKTHSGYYDKTKYLDVVLQMSVVQQIEWLVEFGTFLTIAARSGYPIQDSPGSLEHLVAFNEIQHAIYGCMHHLRSGTARPMEAFLDGLVEVATARGVEQDFLWALNVSLERLSAI